MRIFIPTALTLLFSFLPKATLSQDYPSIEREFVAMSVEQLTVLAEGNCTSIDDCADWRRRAAAKTLAEMYPEVFLGIASKIYEEGGFMASFVATLFWQSRVEQTTDSQQREALLWEIYDGKAEGLIEAARYRSVKVYAADQLCESGSHDRFSELRSYLTTLWTDVSTVTGEATHCKERHEAIRKFGSKLEAAIAMLEGNTSASSRKTKYWIVETVEESLQDLEPETRARIEKALVSALLRWQGDTESHAPYSSAYWLLVQEYDWQRSRLAAAGITQRPLIH